MRPSIALILLLLQLNLYSQANEKTLSKAETFSANSGTLIQRTYIDVDKLEGVEFELAIFTDLINDRVEKAMRIERERRSYSGNVFTDIGLVDLDELENLRRTIAHIITFIQEPATHYTELTFKTRTGVEFGCFWASTRWGGYMKIEPYDSDSLVKFDVSDFPTLLSIIEKVQAKALE